ncbi:unnamed protein product [Prunus brigantina]
MSNLRRVLERQQKEKEEIRRRRADEDQDADEEEEQMLAAAVCMLNQLRQHRRHRAPNVDKRRESRKQVDEIERMGKSTILECLVRFCDTMENLYTREYLHKPTPRDLQRLLQKAEAQREYGNRKGQKSIILEAVASFDCWVWHAFFGVAGSQNDLNVLGQSPVFASFQKGYRKDVERCFGILQACWAIIRVAARMLDEEVLRSIMMTCIILHNMIVEDEYDYDAPEVFEPDPMNTALTRIYERPMGPDGQLMEPEPLLRDGQYNNPMIDRYQEMQSSYVHERRQLDLIEHLWEMKGNHSG